MASKLDSTPILREFGDRCEKLRMYSTDALAMLIAQGRIFDLAYIDGSHDVKQISVDSDGTWQMLASHGLTIWDDYLGGQSLPNPPKSAIDKFCDEHRGEFIVRIDGYQLAIQKLPTSSLV